MTILRLLVILGSMAMTSVVARADVLFPSLAPDSSRAHVTLRGEQGRLLELRFAPPIGATIIGWYRNGAPLTNQTSGYLAIPALTFDDSGFYHAKYRQSGEERMSQSAFVVVTAGALLVNLSTRVYVRPNQPAIVGFVLNSGGAGRRLLVRAIGPSLARFGVEGFLRRPSLALFKGSVRDFNFLTQANGNSNSFIVEATRKVGAFPLADNTQDLAGFAVVSPGVYSIVVSSADNTEGEVLVEVYEDI